MRLVICILFAVLIAASVHAATIHVPADQPTIQAGINAAVNGDTVLVAPGTYKEAFAYKGKSIAIIGEKGADSTFLSCDTAITALIQFDNTSDTLAILRGFTVQDVIHYGSNIGLVSLPYSSGAIRGCRFLRNHDQPPQLQGESAIRLFFGDYLVVDSCTFVENTGIGGAAIGVNGHARITNCEFIRNSTYLHYGGAVAVGGSVSVENCLFAHNRNTGSDQGYSSGGAVFLSSSGGCVFRNNTFVGNETGGNGGGISFWYCGGGNIVEQNIFVHNQGCAITLVASPMPTLRANDAFSNFPTDYGSGIVPDTCSISADPIFCDTAEGSYTIRPVSPCAPEHNSCSVLIGTFPVTCFPRSLQVPSEYLTIQAAIDASFDGDTVLVAPGTYTGTGNRDVEIRLKSVTLKAEGGPGSAKIECGGSMSEQHRAFRISGNQEAATIISGIYITGGYADYGAGLSLEDNSFVALDHCRIGSCYAATQGGGVFVGSGCILTMEMVELSANSTLSRGAGIMGLNAREIRGDSCIFTDNRVDWDDGAGLYAEGGLVSLRDCVFNSNRAHHNGGGICLSQAALHLSGTRFEKDSAQVGGGLHAQNTTLQVDSSEFIGNQSLEYGGGAYIRNCSSQFSHCLFAANSSSYGGGVYYYSGSSASVMSSTFLLNSSNLGGAIYCVVGSSPTIDQTIISYSSRGEGLYCNNTAGQCLPQLTCCCVYGNASGDWIGCIETQLGVNGNILADPLFCDTAALEVKLKTTSPCLENSSGCGLIGAYSVGCVGVSSLNIAEENSLLNVIGHSPVFVWSYVPLEGFAQSSAEIAVGDDPDWQAAEQWSPPVLLGPDTIVQYQGLELLDGKTYYVRLRITDGGYWTNWYQTSFRMNSVPSVPVPRNPINDNVAGSLPILWVTSATDAESDPLVYEFSGFHDTDCVSGPAIEILNVPGTPDSTGGQVTTPLSENCRYWWYVRAYDGYEYSNSSSPATFRVDGVPEAPTTPVLISPPDSTGGPEYNLLLTFRWQASSDPDPYDTVRYKLEVSLTPTFAFVFAKDSLLQPQFTLTDSLFFATHYWWRVTAKDRTGHAITSPIPNDFWTWTLGDLNYSHLCDLSDLSAIVSYLTGGGYVISPKMVGDVSGDCFVDLTDLSIMVNYLTGGGVKLRVGCE